MRRIRPVAAVLLIVAAAGLGSIGCGVSGHTAAPASARSPEVTSSTPSTNSGTTESTAPRTTQPGSTTVPDSVDPNTIPLDRAEVRRTLTRLYKSLGMTDKEAKCAVQLTVDTSGGPTPSDPTNFDVSKYLRCFGPDQVPGGSD